MLLLLAGLAYGGLKTYVYLNVKRQLDALIAAAAPFAYIQYGSIGSTLEGVIHISDISANPRGVDDTLTIKNLNIITPGPMFYLQGEQSMRTGEIPGRFGVQLQDMRVSLNGSMIRMLEKAQIDRSGVKPSAEDACSLSQAFVTAQYRELGYRELNINADMMLERANAPDKLHVSMQFALENIERGNFEITIADVGSSVYMSKGATPKMERLEFNYIPDQRFIKRRIEVCSQRMNIAEDAYVNLLQEKSDSAYAKELGFVPGPGLREAISKVVTGGGGVHVVSHPASPLDITTLHLYKPQDWPNMLGLSVSVNNVEITDLSFEIPKQQGGGNPFFSFAKAGGAKTDDAGGKNAREKVVQKKPMRPGYYKIPIENLGNLVGKNVRITTYEGKRREGVVLSVEDKIIFLERRIRGGTFSTRVYIGAIDKIELYRKN